MKFQVRRFPRTRTTLFMVVLAMVTGVAICGPQNHLNQNDDTKAVRAFVTNFGGDGVSVIDPEQGRSIAEVKTGSKPHGVAIAPDGSVVLVSNEGDGTLSFIDPATNKVVETLQVGKNPNQIQISCSGSKANWHFFLKNFKSQTREKIIRAPVSG